MPLPLIGVGVTAAASFILRKGVAKAAKRFTPSLLKKAKEFIKNKKLKQMKQGKLMAEDLIKKGANKVKSKKKTEKDFSKTPLGSAAPKYKFDTLQKKLKKLDSYSRD